ncbi:hypothetical protein MMC34_005490 [Xylographa carneopallida]|nr:hypothetical protein [Xylographa carneopallida]
MPYALQNRNVLITGGSRYPPPSLPSYPSPLPLPTPPPPPPPPPLTFLPPSGLGALTALKFAAEGSRLAINYVANAERAAATAREIERLHGGKVVIVQGDMGVRADCERVVREASAALRGLDVIVSNAVSAT